MSVLVGESVRVHAICVPLGENVGWESAAALLVIRTTPVPSAFIV
jgi:hypothetical protein